MALGDEQATILYRNVHDEVSQLSSLFTSMLLLLPRRAPAVSHTTAAPPPIEEARGAKHAEEVKSVEKEEVRSEEEASVVKPAEKEEEVVVKPEEEVTKPEEKEEEVLKPAEKEEMPEEEDAPTSLLYKYTHRAPFAPTQSSRLRVTDAYPAPPTTTDALCPLIPPQPIPQPQGRLQAFVASLLAADTQKLQTGAFAFSVPAELHDDYHYLSEYRAKFVRDSACFAWAGCWYWHQLIGRYRRFAWGSDEVRPMSGGRFENWSGIGMTLLDGLDTLELLGLHKEFEKAAEWVETRSNFDIDRSFSVFETTIRVVGGLLSAYELTKKRVFLDKAVEVGERLLPAFDTPSGYPRVGASAACEA